MSVAAEVRSFIESKLPLTVIQLPDIYNSLNNLDNAAIRAALYGFSAGSPVAKTQRVSKFFAIRLPIEYSQGETEDIFLSLPGIPRDRVLEDLSTTGTITQIRERLKSKYGKETIKYWADAAQRRSVDYAGAGMRNVRRRDKTCRLCEVKNKLRQSNNLPIENSRPVRACHIISRKTIFWTILDEVDRQEGNIFTDTSSTLIMQKLRNEPLHSGEQFIIGLCHEHDKLLLSSLMSATT